MKPLLLTSLLIAAFALTAHAQNLQDSNHPSSSTAKSTSANSAPNNQDDPIAKALEQAVNRLAVAEERNRLLEEQLKAKDDRIAAKDDRITNLTERLTLRSANQVDLTTVATGDQRLLSACENTLAKADAEIHRLRYPGFFRSVFDTRALGGAIVGFGVGRAMK